MSSNSFLDITCVTNLPGFYGVCLEDTDVLWTALVSVHDRECAYLPRHDNVPNKSYRYAPYRQFTWWIHVKLGRHIRRLIPSCVVNKIRERFPEEDGLYCGYKGDDEGVIGNMPSLGMG